MKDFQFSLPNKLTGLLSRETLLHVLFWLFVLVGLVWMDLMDKPLPFIVLVNFVNLFFYGIVVYFNILYLIPRYLGEKWIFMYLTLLTLTVMIITPIKMLILFLIFSGTPELQAQLLVDQKLFFLTTFVIAGASTLAKIITDWVRYQRDRKELQTQTMQSELKFLRSQINPHFFFNTLNNLYALTLKKSDKAPETVLKLAEMMRYMLYECNERRVLLSKEINYIQNYIDLESLRQNPDAHISFTLEGDPEELKIAPLLFVPFLENSFKHGLQSSISNGFVNIVLRIDDQFIDFQMSNSKENKNQHPKEKRSGGIGLVNVKRRLQLLYPDKYELKIEDLAERYSVRLKLDLK